MLLCKNSVFVLSAIVDDYLDAGLFFAWHFLIFRSFIWVILRSSFDFFHGADRDAFFHGACIGHGKVAVSIDVFLDVQHTNSIWIWHFKLLKMIIIRNILRIVNISCLRRHRSGCQGVFKNKRILETCVLCSHNIIRIERKCTQLASFNFRWS